VPAGDLDQPADDHDDDQHLTGNSGRPQVDQREPLVAAVAA
jgi:hypothetical protein